ncbi:ISAzo13 family transposase [Chloroflexi bacterium TSY]|nr:ISAzo13 family transposase [Chloroflexi bacterium TSY]
MTISPEMVEVLKETKAMLSGYERRHFMAQTVKTICEGSPTKAERELGWNRVTIAKALEELEGGFCYVDQSHRRGRKKAEDHIPTLLADMVEIADQFSQTDPTFRTPQLYTRLTAAEMRTQLIEQKGYTDEELPGEEAIRLKLNELGYGSNRVKKSQPVKKIPETDAIFDRIHQINQEADADETVLRLSWDAKATILLDRFSREGISRVVVKALDHDFQDKKTEKVTPFGIYLPSTKELFLYLTQSKVTSDFIVDCLIDFWESVREHFPHVKTLVINQDNGPENHTRRTQFMYRLTQFVEHYRLSIQLACYPPYHSKYNPIERVWGHLEKHWNGSLLDSLETVLNFARSFRFNQLQPFVHLNSTLYETGVKLTQKEMDRLAQRFQRLPGLEKWFVLIPPLHSLVRV